MCLSHANVDDHGDEYDEMDLSYVCATKTEGTMERGSGRHLQLQIIPTLHSELCASTWPEIHNSGNKINNMN